MKIEAGFRRCIEDRLRQNQTIGDDNRYIRRMLTKQRRFLIGAQRLRREDFEPMFFGADLHRRRRQVEPPPPGRFGARV